MVLAQFVALFVVIGGLLYLFSKLEPMDPEEADELWREFYRDVGEMFFAPGWDREDDE